MTSRFAIPFNVPLRYVGPNAALVPTRQAPRRPTVNDKDKIQTIWRVKENSLGINEGEEWILIRYESNGDATWVMFTGGGSGPIISQTGDDGVVVNPDGVGNFDWTGLIVPNATNAKPLYIESDGANGLNVDLQLATTVTPTPADSNDAGAACFNENQFQIDATSGMVSLVGSTTDAPILSIETDDGAPNVVPDANGAVAILGGTGISVTGQGPGNTVTVALTGGGGAIDSIDVDFATAPGTDPVVPDGDGLMTVTGATVNNGTNANSPVATHSRAANAYNVEVQVAAAITGAPADKFDAGLSSYDDTHFGVDSNGYVTNLAAPIQSAFSAYVSSTVSNVTGDGTLYRIIWDTENYDSNGDYDNTTGIFTAPYDGLYVFHAGCLFTSIDSGHTSGKMRFRINSQQVTGGSERGNYYLQATVGGALHHSISTMWPMSQGDTAEVIVQIDNGTLTVDIDPGTPVGACSFAGYIIQRT